MSQDWDSYDSGPFCRHWNDFADCRIVCKVCGHRCQDHNHSDGENDCMIHGCECKEFVEPD